ncbi:MAG: nucleoside hydrolase [Candidatus Puniceispirillaceae bacterium]
MSQTSKVIIDTDPGIDDAMAIHMAFADPRLEVVGLTTIFGNVNVEQATRNALWLAEQAAYPLDVAKGAERPLVQEPNTPSYYVHGDEGFGDLPAVSPTTKAHALDAADYIIQTCRAASGEITLCPVGPLTNIAIALQRDPDLVHHVKSVVIMGGAGFVPGNVTDYAEANIWNDPHAAEIVFAADWEVVMIGLDVTTQVMCLPSDYQSVANEGGAIGRFINDISIFYTRFYATIYKEDVCVLHDPCAIIAITDPALFEYRSLPVRVICDGPAIGQTVPDETLHRSATKIAIGVDVDSVKAHYLTMSKNAQAAKDNRLA